MERYAVVHAVDLPGFGRSLAPEILYDKNTSEYEVIDIYCEWFNQLFHSLNLTDTEIYADTTTDTQTDYNTNNNNNNPKIDRNDHPENNVLNKPNAKPKPYIVAHSFGGTLSTHCLSRNPALASRLLLADVPGRYIT
jgi:pimeloyl-ACP methyl ester carboxylesterase